MKQGTLHDVLIAETRAALSRLKSKRAGEPHEPPYITAGLRSWDAAGGSERGVLTVCAAGTGDGKSVIKLHLARAAATAGHSVLLLDFEDPARKTVNRILAGATGINSAHIDRLELGEGAEDQLRAAAKGAEWAKLVTYVQGIDSLAEAERVILDSNHDLVLIDYAQVLPDAPGKPRERSITDFARFLAVDAERKYRAIRLFSQTKPEVETRGCNRFDWSKKKDLSGFVPVGISDLAWSSALGQIAKVVEFLYRPGKWARKLGVLGEPGMPKEDDEMHVIFAKVSFGMEPKIRLLWDGPTSTVRDIL